jgi:hypothetical protein
MLLNYQQKDDVKIVWYVLSEEIADNYEFCSLKSMYSAKKAPTVDHIADRYMNCLHIEDMVFCEEQVTTLSNCHIAAEDVFEWLYII